MPIRWHPCKIAGNRHRFNPSAPHRTGTLLHPRPGSSRSAIGRSGLFGSIARRSAILPLALLTALSATGCRDAMAGFGTGPHARASADQLFGSFVERHWDLYRNPKFEYAKQHLSRASLSPSRIFDDTATWTSGTGNVRRLETFGSFVGNRYGMTSRAGIPAPTRPADGRHETTLTRLGDNEYRWDTTVDFAIGVLKPAQAATVITRLLSAGEGKSEHEARAEVAATAPHSANALGTAFTLDTLRPQPLADGSTVVTLSTTVHADLLKRRFPLYAEYVRKYVEPARYRFVLADHAGVPFLEGAAQDRTLNIRLRTHGGHLAPLTGPLRPMPDSMVLYLDAKAKVKIFTVGFHDLAMDFVNSSRGDAERDWTITARHEPKWDLPFITARLLRAPLRRPFQGEGAMFRMAVRSGEGGGPTLLTRQSRLTVQESGILNFINSLSSTAMDDFASNVEREENLWLRELFAAIREDARAALTP